MAMMPIMNNPCGRLTFISSEFCKIGDCTNHRSSAQAVVLYSGTCDPKDAIPKAKAFEVWCHHGTLLHKRVRSLRAPPTMTIGHLTDVNRSTAQKKKNPRLSVDDPSNYPAPFLFPRTLRRYANLAQ